MATGHGREIASAIFYHFCYCPAMGGRDALIEELRATVARLEAVIEQQAARIAVLELELAEAIPLPLMPI